MLPSTILQTGPSHFFGEFGQGHSTPERTGQNEN